MGSNLDVVQCLLGISTLSTLLARKWDVADCSIGHEEYGSTTGGAQISTSGMGPLEVRTYWFKQRQVDVQVEVSVLYITTANLCKIDVITQRRNRLGKRLERCHSCSNSTHYRWKWHWESWCRHSFWPFLGIGISESSHLRQHAENCPWYWSECQCG